MLLFFLTGTVFFPPPLDPPEDDWIADPVEEVPEPQDFLEILMPGPKWGSRRRALKESGRAPKRSSVAKSEFFKQPPGGVRNGVAS